MNKIEAMEKLQVQILTGLAAYWTKEGGLCVNPFYRHDLKSIKEHINFAKEVYPHVFKSFLNGWFKQYGTFDNFPMSNKKLEKLLIE
jgi:hypothetical protein